MGFVVLPALVTDISDVYDVYFAAFKDNAVTRALFPSASQEDMMDPDSEFRKAHTAHTFEYWQKDPTQHTLKCVDCETGKVVGMALWDIYLTPSNWRKSEITWLQGEEKERAEALISPLWETREKLWLNQRYLYCHVIAVHPDHQRKGIGQLLVEYGINVAKQTELPIFIESSSEAKRLYQKMGCQLLKEKPIHRSKYIQDGGSDSDEDTEIDLFIWASSAGKARLPKAVEVL